MAWTEAELRKQMRKAGWRNLGHGAYRHDETGKIVQLWKWERERGEWWRQWAEAEQTPPPF